MDAMDKIICKDWKKDMNLFTVKKTVIAHGTTALEVVYTNDISQVEETLEILKRKQLKQEYDKEFMGLDFEYINAEKDKHEVAVVQLCVDKTVLVWQLSRYDFALICFLFWGCTKLKVVEPKNILVSSQFII